MLTKDQILAARDFIVKPVDVPEWGGQVFVKTLDFATKYLFIELAKSNDLKLGDIKIVVQTCCDETGKLLFTEDDIEILSAKSYNALQRIVTAAIEINTISEAEIQDREKN